MPAKEIDKRLCKIVDNSDEVFSISFAPLLKDIDWYLGTEKFSYSRVARWWTNYSSQTNDYIASHDILFHTKNRNFNKQKESSAKVIRRLIIYKNLLNQLYADNINDGGFPKHLIDNLLPIFFEKVIRLPIFDKIYHVEISLNNRDLVQNLYDVLKKYRELNKYHSHDIFQEIRKLIYPLITIKEHSKNLSNHEKRYLQNKVKEKLKDKNDFFVKNYFLKSDFRITFFINKKLRNDFKDIILVFLYVDLPAGYHLAEDFKKNLNKLNRLYYDHNNNFKEYLPEKFIFQDTLNKIKNNFSLSKATFLHKQFLGVPERKLVYSRDQKHIFELPDGSYYAIENKYDKLTIIGKRIYRIPQDDKKMNFLKSLFYKISEYSYAMFRKNKVSLIRKDENFLEFTLKKIIKNIKASFFYSVHITLLQKYYVDSLKIIERKNLFDMVRMTYDENK